MTDLDELIAEARRWAHGHPNRRVSELIHGLVDALETATRVPGQGEPNDDRESLITERTYGHGSITLTHYRSSGRIGVVQRGENSVMDVTDLLVFLQDSGLDEDFSRAAVPDAATEEMLKRVEEAEAQSAEDRVEWQQMKERASQRFNAYQQKKRELRQMEIRAEKAEAERDAALAAVEVTRKLHHKITRYGNDYYSISAESYEDDPSSYDDLEPFDLCAECYEVERLICEECGGGAPIGHRSSWPCPTVAALDEAPEPEEKP